MWDVLVTLLLMFFGALVVIVGGAVFVWTIFHLQNGGKDD
jgi:hypothetical protein